MESTHDRQIVQRMLYVRDSIVQNKMCMYNRIIVQFILFVALRYLQKVSLEFYSITYGRCNVSGVLSISQTKIIRGLLYMTDEMCQKYDRCHKIYPRVATYDR